MPCSFTVHLNNKYCEWSIESVRIQDNSTVAPSCLMNA